MANAHGIARQWVQADEALGMAEVPVRKAAKLRASPPPGRQLPPG